MSSGTNRLAFVGAQSADEEIKALVAGLAAR